ncbi:DUF6168 family protein [Mesonia maritima]|uniref:Uncharacterized protein n=1 Tax=Mesonia maritima TaxID=1793873 RepID=A0ABU1K2K8_9FLAO|nr:DUF6168 family protein [Mesonia maritima]MDR6299844.1 hypothetical protein [Mesonia maritima]
MKIKSTIFQFLLILLCSVGPLYFLHKYFVQEYYSASSLALLNFSYKFNVGITFLFTITIILLSKKFKDQLGFIFMIGGFLKIALFLIWKQTTSIQIEKAEYLHFFIPYFICLIVEIFYVSKILKKINYQEDN